MPGSRTHYASFAWLGLLCVVGEGHLFPELFGLSSRTRDMSTPKKIQTITKQADGSLSIVYTDGSEGALDGKTQDDKTIQAALIFGILSTPVEEAK